MEDGGPPFPLGEASIDLELITDEDSVADVESDSVFWKNRNWCSVINLKYDWDATCLRQYCQ